MAEEQEPANGVEANLINWKVSRFEKLPVGGLIARNAVAHKWKSPFRSMMVRECCFWRQYDLMDQSYTLFCNEQELGARILLRSGFETLAVLTYLNLITAQVLKGELNFHIWSDKTSKLLVGSRENDSMPKAINIMTILEKCDKRYPGLMKVYAQLSETAHPNYEGLMRGYTKTNYDEYETTFMDRWMEIYGDKHLDQMMLCMECFHFEYNDQWDELFLELEKWIEVNDEILEATKHDPLPQ